MVVATMAWRHKATLPEANGLGILAFDAGKTMCRLISLYHSLSDDEFAKLRNEVIKSKGVTYLNSQHECFLLNLAAAERLEELDASANAVARLGRKCSDLSLSHFDLVYADLKLGLIDLRKQSYDSRNTYKIVDKMEKLVSSTANLHFAMESVAEMENSEKKRQRWKIMETANTKYHVSNAEHFDKKMAYHRKQVQHYKEVSLWNQTFNKTVGIMAKIVCIIYARICSLFGTYITNCNCYNSDYCCCLLEHRELYQKNLCLYEEPLQKRVAKSGPIPKTSNKTGVIRFLNHHLQLDFSGEMEKTDKNNNKVLKLAPQSTVGGAGLAARYADVILFVERCLHSPATVGEGTRETLYEMLPERLRGKVRAKLRGRWRRKEEEEGEALAEGWRDAVEELMEWLAPVAHDTVRWQAERHMEKARFETKTTALLLQTLHYSDLEKAEAAIVEVLVGLSCVFWCERR